MKTRVSLIFIITFFIIGCTANTQRYKFEYAKLVQDSSTWPKGSPQPRYKYVGDIYGESNLTPIERVRSTLHEIWLFLIGEVEDTPLDLIRPQGIWGDNKGTLYVTDVSRRGVMVINLVQGDVTLWQQATDSLNFISPIGLTINANGDLLVTDSELGLISILNKSGKPIGTIKHKSLSRPTGIARVRDRQEIYVSDTHKHDVKVFNDNGELIRIIGNKGSELLEFNSPTYLVDYQDGILLSDTLNARVQLLSAELVGKTIIKDTAIRSYGHRGMKIGNLIRPKGVAVDSNKNIYIIESYFDHMLIFSEQGEFLLPLGGTGHGSGEFYLPAGIWIDDRDRIYIADMMNGRISVFQFLGESGEN